MPVEWDNHAITPTTEGRGGACYMDQSMPILYRFEILMQFDKLSYCKQLSELYFSLETLIQVIFSKKFSKI